MSTLEDAVVTVVEPAPAVHLGIDELCNRYAARVYRFATLLCRSRPDAEDLAQSALERAILALPGTAVRADAIEGWLWRIVVNAARDAGRAARRRRLLLERLVAHSPPNVELEIADSITDDALLHAVRSLSRRHRTLIALRFGADLDYQRVGAALGISPVAARLATRRALHALKASMEESQ